MSIHHVRSSLLIPIVVLLVTACGGGSDDKVTASGNGAHITPTATFTTEAEALRIVQNVADDRHRDFYDRDIMWLWEGFSRLDLSAENNFSCNSGTVVNMAVDIARQQVTAELDQCVNLFTDGSTIGFGTLDGKFLLTILEETSTAYTVKFQFQGFSFDGNVYNGDLEINYFNDTTVEIEGLTATNLTYTMADSADTLQHMELEVETQSSSEFFQFATRGAIDGFDFDGIVTFNTPVLIEFDRGAFNFTAGKLVIYGAGGSTIEITDASDPNAPRTANVRIDIDGDGSAEFTPQWDWANELGTSVLGP